MKYRRRLARRLQQLKGRQTQSVFAKRIGIGQASLNRILNKKQDVSIDMLETMCTFLEIDICELLRLDREAEAAVIEFPTQCNNPLT